MLSLMLWWGVMVTIVFGQWVYRQDIVEVVDIDTSYGYLEQYCTYSQSQQKYNQCEGVYGVYEESIVPKVQKIVQKMIDDSPNGSIVTATIAHLDAKLVQLKKRTPQTRTKFLVELIQQEFGLFLTYYSGNKICDDPLLSQFADCVDGGIDTSQSYHDMLVRRRDTYQRGSLLPVSLTSQKINLPVYVGYLENTTDEPISLEEVTLAYWSENLDIRVDDFVMFFWRKETDTASSPDCALQNNTSATQVWIVLWKQRLAFPIFKEIPVGDKIDICVVARINHQNVIQNDQKGEIEMEYIIAHAEKAHTDGHVVPMVMHETSVREVEVHTSWRNNTSQWQQPIYTEKLRFVRKDNYQRTGSYPHLIEGHDWWLGARTPVYVAMIENRSNEAIHISDISFNYALSKDLNINQTSFGLYHDISDVSLDQRILSRYPDTTCWSLFHNGNRVIPEGDEEVVFFDIDTTISPWESLELCVFGSIEQGIVMWTEKGEYILHLDDISLTQVATSQEMQPSIFENYSVREIGKAYFSLRNDNTSENLITIVQDDFWSHTSVNTSLGRFFVRNNSDERIVLKSFDIVVHNGYFGWGLLLNNTDKLAIDVIDMIDALVYPTFIHAGGWTQKIYMDVVLEPGEEKEIDIQLWLIGDYDDWAGKKMRFVLNNLMWENEQGEKKQWVGNRIGYYHILSSIDVDW